MNKIKIFFLSFFLLISINIFALIDDPNLNNVNFKNFQKYQKVFTKDEVLKKIETYVQKNDDIEDFYEITKKSLNIFSSKEDKKKKKYEYRLFFSSKKNKKEQILEKKNLKDLKIAIDPGHLGGRFSLLEQRFIDIPINKKNKISQRIEFDEGTLAYLTAIHLKKLLEDRGVIVFITRDGIEKSAMDDDFDTWYTKSKEKINETSLSKIFIKYYNHLDLQKRAEKINDFKPDLTIVIHLNSYHISQKEKILTNENFNMVFIPGAFMRNELDKKRNRYEFLRLIVTDDIEHSKNLSKCIVDSFQKRLAIPTVSDSADLSYIRGVCIKADPGVYCRNLALTRYVHGTICYGESLIQNNVDECKRLSKKDVIIDGIKSPKRIVEVAEAYYQGILNYLEKE